MELIERFSHSEMDDISIILKCLLDRIPIIVYGNNESEIEFIINEFLNLISFRNSVIYYTDFVSTDEYEEIVENEKIDYEVIRNIYICYPFALKKLVEDFKNFKSWIIGISKKVNEKKQINLLYKTLENSGKSFLEININQNNLKTKLHNKNEIYDNYSLEKRLYQNAINRTEISVEKMKRVISKRIKKSDLDEDFIEELLNFSLEEKELKENLLKGEINDFYQASKRSFSIFNRLFNLKGIGFETKISSKTLFSTIAYEEIPNKRLIQFIYNEWSENYQFFFENKKISKYMDKMESLWG